MDGKKTKSRGKKRRKKGNINGGGGQGCAFVTRSVRCVLVEADKAQVSDKSSTTVCDEGDVIGVLN